MQLDNFCGSVLMNPNCLLALCPNSADSLQIPTELHAKLSAEWPPSGFASEVLAGLFPSS